MLGKFDTREEAKQFCKDHGIKNYSIHYARIVNKFYLYELEEKQYEDSTKFCRVIFSSKPYEKIAEQLGYPLSVIEKLKLTRNDEAATRVMVDARHGIY